MPHATLEDFPFRTELSVRDYECDMQGIVNNAIYQNYLEHARHLYLRSCGVDFAELTRSGIHLVVTRVELDYLSPLTSGDSFWVGVRAERMSPLRGVFYQAIFRMDGVLPTLKARVIGASLNAKGKPALCPALSRIFPDPSMR